jgi:hypothetical protein
MTATEGEGTAEHLGRFPVAAGDIILADRGYCHPAGVATVARQGADVIVRWNTSVPLFGPDQRRWAWLPELRQLRTAGSVGQWPAWVHDGEQRWAGRVCAVRKSEQAIASAQRQIDRREQKHQARVKPETREYACYVLVFTTLLESVLSALEVLEYYRFRWQIELLFKRLKSILAVGHLPKHDEQSSRAWLYGKLVVALLTQKLVRLGSSISPWGYELGPAPGAQSLA